MPELPSIVDAAWLESELGAADLVVGDVRGPNAHARGHIAGSRPLVLGSPPPMSDATCSPRSRLKSGCACAVTA